jgi:roadblock/LC7 domain-containing protein
MHILQDRRSLGRRALLGFVMFAGVGLTYGCDEDGETGDDSEGSELRDVSLVGQLDGGAYVAIVADEGELIAYACDGTEDTVSLSAWFTGAHEGGVFDLTNPAGARISGEFDGALASGELTLPDGSALAFEANVEDGDSGLYFFEEEAEEGNLRGGWIVREAGQRGAVINRTTDDLVTGTQLTISELRVFVFGRVFTIARLLRPFFT